MERIFDVKMLISFCLPSPQCYKCAELEKKRKYEERVCEMVNGTFCHLVFHALDFSLPETVYYELPMKMAMICPKNFKISWVLHP